MTHIRIPTSEEIDALYLELEKQPANEQFKAVFARTGLHLHLRAIAAHMMRELVTSEGYSPESIVVAVFESGLWLGLNLAYRLGPEPAN